MSTATWFGDAGVAEADHDVALFGGGGAAAEDEQRAQDNEQKKKTFRNTAIIIAVAVLLSLLFLGVWMWSRSRRRGAPAVVLVDERMTPQQLAALVRRQKLTAFREQITREALAERRFLEDEDRAGRL